MRKAFFLFSFIFICLWYFLSGNKLELIMFYLMIFACLDLIFETDLSPRFTMWSIQLWMAQLISHYVCVYLLSMFHVQCIYEFQFIVVKQCCTTICLRHRSNLTLLLLKHFQHWKIQLQGDGYHTSPAHQRTPLVPHDLGEDFNLDFDDDFPIDARRPKNAK